MMQKTRSQILEILKRKNEATLDELARGVGLSSVTIRAHLAVLERDALVQSEEVRGKVGRPHFVYSLLPKADDWFPKSNHVIANRILDALLETEEQEFIVRMTDRMTERWAQDWSGRVQGSDLATRVSELSAIRSEEGAIAEWERAGGAFLLRQYHCPCWQIARHHPLICEAETSYMRRLLGTTISRQECRADGANNCVFRIEAH